MKKYLENIDSIFSNAKTMKRLQKMIENNESVSFKDTIIELFSFGKYTLIQYYKGGNIEYNAALNYDRKTKTWDAGNYAYSLESALVICLEKMNSVHLKNERQISTEEKYGLTWDRMSELATLFKDGLVLDGEADANEYFDGECEMDAKEKEYFGVSDWYYKD